MRSIVRTQARGRSSCLEFVTLVTFTVQQLILVSALPRLKASLPPSHTPTCPASHSLETRSQSACLQVLAVTLPQRPNEPQQRPRARHRLAAGSSARPLCDQRCAQKCAVEPLVERRRCRLGPTLQPLPQPQPLSQLQSQPQFWQHLSAVAAVDNTSRGTECSHRVAQTAARPRPTHRPPSHALLRPPLASLGPGTRVCRTWCTGGGPRAVGRARPSRSHTNKASLPRQ